MNESNCDQLKWICYIDLVYVAVMNCKWRSVRPLCPRSAPIYISTCMCNDVCAWFVSNMYDTDNLVIGARLDFVVHFP